MRDEPVEDADRVRLDDELVVIRAEVVRDAPGVFQLVERRLVEPDGKRLHARAGGLRHQADNQARVDAAGQERAERNVAHQMRADGVGEHVEERHGRVGL